MASRGLLFFMTPGECERAICDICQDLSLWVLLERFLRETRIEAGRAPSTFQFADGAAPERIWLSETEPHKDVADTLKVPSAVFGRVMLYPSRIEEDVLFMAHLGAISDWFDMERLRSFENPASIRLFNRMAPRLRRMLPYVSRNRWAGDKAWLPARVRHSAGVSQWVRRGGRIAQFGAPGVEYTINEAAEDPGIRRAH